MQTRIHGSNGSSWGNDLEIRLKSLFGRAVNVEDFGEAEKNYVVSKPRVDLLD